MEHQRVIELAMREAQDILWDSLPPDSPAKPVAVRNLRLLFRRTQTRLSLRQASDSLLAFHARAVQRILFDDGLEENDIFAALVPVLDDPGLNALLGLPPNSRITIVHRRRP
jgi:hypothetical protein